MCEQLMGDYTYRDQASRQFQLFKSFVNFRATSLVSISYIFPPTVVLRTLFLILNMLRAHYISMSLATVIWECSLNQFSTSLFVSLFVDWEPRQIFMGENTEYRANLVKARVNFPVTLLHIYRVCQYKLFLSQYKLFLISEDWEGFTEPSKPSLEYHWSDNQ